jgi:hypothetical protein
MASNDPIRPETQAEIRDFGPNFQQNRFGASDAF